MRPFLELNTSMERMICIPAYTYAMENEVICKLSLSEVKLIANIIVRTSNSQL